MKTKYKENLWKTLLILLMIVTINSIDIVIHFTIFIAFVIYQFIEHFIFEKSVLGKSLKMSFCWPYYSIKYLIKNTY